MTNPKMSPNEYKFYKLCLKKKFFEKNKRVLIALSGGQDSMTLFNWLYNLRESFGIKLAVAHINHKVRQASDYEEAYLRNKMAELGVPFYFAEFSGTFSEEAARKFRYDYFEKVMKENAFTVLVTAHHKGDQAETVFMRLLTGRRLRHLNGILERQYFAGGELIRPFLTFEKSELNADFFFEDKTNSENEHLRNRVRNIYLPELKVENPKIQEVLIDLADESRLALAIIDEQINGLDLVGKRVNLSMFLSQSEGLQYFIFQKYLVQFQELKLNKRTFNDLLKIVRRPQQYHGLISKVYYFVKDSTDFYIDSSKSEKELEVLEKNPNNSSYLEVNFPVDMDYEIRIRESGDSIQFHGKRKTLKKFFIDNKIDLENRDFPVIAVGPEIYAIPSISTTSDLSLDLQSAKIKRTIWTRVRSR
ncbi:tRNA lysidine(34) synthetase TilS [Lactovum miscens]|uniref:tRNA(Ile)-lysidine synthase n=1 Tax=Lactovum miscens TaxID=190387 RepID=A0A841C7F8_9LACT|nr:tRNA lysidine(34) synthetase TilS [Lactovum miscens]MBB5887329.1 tRNA(Ile)-lysidine synthase [Lactovum miscens]